MFTFDKERQQALAAGAVYSPEGKELEKIEKAIASIGFLEDDDWVLIDQYGHSLLATFQTLHALHCDLLNFIASNGSSVGFFSDWSTKTKLRQLTNLLENDSNKEKLFINLFDENQDPPTFIVRQVGKVWESSALPTGGGYQAKELAYPRDILMFGANAEPPPVWNKVYSDLKELLAAVVGSDWMTASPDANYVRSVPIGDFQDFPATLTLNSMIKDVPEIRAAVTLVRATATRIKARKLPFGVGWMRQATVGLTYNSESKVPLPENKLLSRAFVPVLTQYWPENVIRYVTQTPKGPVPVLSLQTWMSIYYARGFQYGDTDLPEFVTPLSQIAEKLKSKDWTGTTRLKVNSDNLAVTSEGEMAFVPPTDPKVLVEFEAQLQAEIELAAAENLPFKYGRIQDDPYYAVPRTKAENEERRQKRQRLAAYQSIPLVNNWDIGVSLTPIGGGGFVTANSLEGFVAPDERVVSDVLTKNLDQTEAYLGTGYEGFPLRALGMRVVETYVQFVAAGVITALKPSDFQPDGTQVRSYEMKSASIALAFLRELNNEKAGKGWAAWVNIQYQYPEALNAFIQEADSPSRILDYATKNGIPFEDESDLKMYIPTVNEEPIGFLPDAREHYIAIDLLFKMAAQLADVLTSGDVAATMLKIAEVMKGDAPTWHKMSTTVIPTVLMLGRYAPKYREIREVAQRQYDDTAIKPEDKITSLDQVRERAPKAAGCKDMALFPHQSEVINILQRVSRDPAELPLAHVNAAIIDVDPGGGKCLVGSTLVPTSAGLLTLEEIWDSAEGNPSLVGRGFRDVSLQLTSTEGPCEATQVYRKAGTSPTVRVSLSDGSIIEGRAEHKLWVYSDYTHRMEFKRLDAIEWQDAVMRAFGTRSFSTSAVKLHSERIEKQASQKTRTYFVNRQLKLPDVMSEDLATVLGYYVAEGYLCPKRHLATFTNHDPFVMKHFLECARRVFGPRSFRHAKGQVTVCPSSKLVISFLLDLLEARKGAKHTSRFKSVPLVVRASPENIQRAFLQALFEGDGCIYPEISGNSTRWHLEFTTISDKLGQQVKYMLDNIGVFSELTRGKRYMSANGENGETKRRRYVNNIYVDKVSHETFQRYVGFISPRKQKELRSAIKHFQRINIPTNGNIYVQGSRPKMPGGELLNACWDRVGSIIGQHTYTVAFGAQERTCKYTTAWACRNAGVRGVRYWNTDSRETAHSYALKLLDKVVAALPSSLHNQVVEDIQFKTSRELLEAIASAQWVFVTETKKLRREKVVYDLSVPGPNSYVANNLFSHNTVIVLADALTFMGKKWVNRPLLLVPGTLTMNWKNDLDMITKAGYNPIVITSQSWNKWGEDAMRKLLRHAPINTVVIITMDWVKGGAEQEIFGSAVVTRWTRIELLREEYKPDYLGVDESHYLKNESSQRNNAAVRLMSIPSIRFIRLASGTIVTDRPTDLVGQMKLIQPYVFGTKSAFEQQFFDAGEGKWKPGAGKDIRKRLNHFVTVVTKKKRDWAFMLPEPEETLLPVNMEQGSEYEAVYDAILYESLENLARTHPKLYKYLKEQDKGGVVDEAKERAIEGVLKQSLARLEQFLLDPEGDPLAEGKKMPPSPKIHDPKHGLIARLRLHFSRKADNPAANKVLVFCRFIRSVNACFNALPADLKKRARVYHGKMKEGLSDFNMSFEERQKLEEEQENEIATALEEADILICTEMSVNTGKNLQIASRIIRLETPWTPGELAQASARVMRPTPPRTPDGGKTWIPHKYKREKIYLDWIFTNNSLEVAKLGRIFSKTAIKAQFDYYGEPGYDKLPELEMVRLNLENLRAFRSLANLGALGENQAEPDSYLDVYKRILQLEMGDYYAKKQTELSEMVPVPDQPRPPGSFILPFAPPLVHPETGAVITKPPVGDIAAIIEKASKKQGVEKTVKKQEKTREEQKQKVKEELEQADKKPKIKPAGKVDTKPRVKPQAEKEEERKVERVKPKVGRGDPSRVTNTPREPDSEVSVYYSICNSLHMVFIDQDEPDFDVKDAKALGMTKIAPYIAAHMPNAKRIQNTLDSLRANGYRLRKPDVEKIMEFVEAFDKKKGFVPAAANQIELKHFLLEKRRPLPPELIEKGIRIWPLIEDGDLYLTADLSQQKAARRLAKRGSLPGSAAKWVEQPGWWAVVCKNKSEVRAKIKQISRTYKIANPEDLEI